MQALLLTRANALEGCSESLELAARAVEGYEAARWPYGKKG